MSSRLPDPGDTIVAVATAAGRSAIGVVRLSGPDAKKILFPFFKTRTPYAKRLARTGTFSVSGERLDRVVVTVFEGPASYTGEDVAEISAHGNPWTIGRIVEALVAAGARQAEPGEFTLRAVSHGKMDLAQAEAIRDFIGAQTARQARMAMLQVEGAISRRIRPIREALVAVIAEIEAAIDFAEDDIAPASSMELTGRLASVCTAIRSVAGSHRGGRVLSEGLRLAIAGRPNVGKSSVFNALTGKQGAIVAPVPGTTRDVLTETVDLEGIPVRLMDTAGLRDSGDLVESIGIERARETLSEVDLVLVVMDLSREWGREDEELLDHMSARPHVVVLNKCDLAAAWSPERLPEGLVVSAKKGDGVERLRTHIVEFLGISRSSSQENAVVTSRRQFDALDEAAELLDQAMRALKGHVPHEMVVLDLYAALAAVGQVAGEVTSEDILERIFSTFCIGK